MKPIKEMTTEEMIEEIRRHLEAFDEDHGFAVISYSHRDANAVYPKVLEWMRNGYNIYLDLDFESHGSDDNWVRLMQERLRMTSCHLAICFRSTHYYYSYASMIELLTMRSEDTKKWRQQMVLPIDVFNVEPIDPNCETAIPEALVEQYKAYYDRLKKAMGGTFCGNNIGEMKVLTEGLREWIGAFSEDEKQGFDYTSDMLLQMLTDKFRKSAGQFFPLIHFIINNWFKMQDLNGNYKSMDAMMDQRFKELKVYRRPAAQPETADQEPMQPPAGTSASAAPLNIASQDGAPAKKRGRPPKRGDAAARPTTEENPGVQTVSGASKPASRIPLAASGSDSDDITLEEIRAAFSDPNTASRFRSVREAMPWGGKGTMDYLMAAVLGGCNGIGLSSPPCQINYYLYAVASGSPKSSGSLGATWTWSSNCRKVIGLEKSGQIPEEYQACFEQMDGSTTLSALRERFSKAEQAPFQTAKNDLILIAADELMRFFSEHTARVTQQV